MYVIPLLVVFLICLAIFLSPILAVILLAVALIGIGAFKYFGGDAVDPENASPPAEAAPGQSPGKHFTTDPDPEGEKTGLWGERRPE
ncbi:MAG TPA: hypothetical protein VGO24_02190 [Solirubrobacterales bacterium]|jgi:hypothetical protein|nr:hypothetical protein [Solirubrobacterales bacterium]